MAKLKVGDVVIIGPGVIGAGQTARIREIRPWTTGVTHQGTAISWGAPTFTPDFNWYHCQLADGQEVSYSADLLTKISPYRSIDDE